LILANRLIAFRTLIGLSAVLYVTSYWLPTSFFADTIDERNLLRLDGYGALFIPRDSFFNTCLFLLWILAAVGLVRLKNWARYLYLILAVWSLISAGLYGIRVSPPAQAMFDIAVQVLDGAILAMAYLGSVRDLFANKIQ
jgi:hypothetical protein